MQHACAASAEAAWDSRTIDARGARAGARDVTVQPRTRGKNGAIATPNAGLSRWPVAVRPLHAWREPGIMRWRSWRAWSAKPHHLPCNGSWTGGGRGEASRSLSGSNPRLRESVGPNHLRLPCILCWSFLYICCKKTCQALGPGVCGIPDVLVLPDPGKLVIVICLYAAENV